MRISRAFTEPKSIFYYLDAKGFFNFLSDKAYLRFFFKLVFKRKLELNNPKSYSEKLQWLKLYDRKAEYTKLVDKYEVKEIVSQKIGSQYIIPTLGVWDSFDEIDFNILPNQFVLKCTHDSGGLVICKDKTQFDIDKARKKITKCLKTDYYKNGREWVYKNVKHRIIAEQYMEDPVFGELRDYKFFCFDGKVKALFIASDRQTQGEETKFDFFDENFNHLPFTNGHPNAKVAPDKPAKFDEMISLAEKLSVGIPQARIDFYEVEDKVYFGEITFFHWSGMKPFVPEEWDYKFGRWINLNGVLNN